MLRLQLQFQLQAKPGIKAVAAACLHCFYPLPLFPPASSFLAFFQLWPCPSPSPVQ